MYRYIEIIVHIIAQNVFTKQMLIIRRHVTITRSASSIRIDNKAHCPFQCLK